MKILNAAYIREWDQYTIQHEPIASIDLMERAAGGCVKWLQDNGFAQGSVHIFCGKGNNGGDGLAIARLLAMQGLRIIVHILEFGHKGTDDFQINLARLHQQGITDIRFIQDENHFPQLAPDELVIDALFGTGLSRGLEGVTAALVTHINQLDRLVISIDIPSGLFADQSSVGHTVIRATHTLSFQCMKLAFMMAENAASIGQVHVLDIGLHRDFGQLLFSRFEYLDIHTARSIYRPRNAFGHKGNFGHALLIAGSYGKTGAAVLSGKAVLRSGAGLLTCHIPQSSYSILQSTLPEAMVLTDYNSSFCTKLETDLTRFDAVGIGPGLGQASETRVLLRELLDAYRGPLVLDADALNILSQQKDLLRLLPAGAILTPHPKEFERLFGSTANEFERIERALAMAAEWRVVIVLKGHHTLIATPDGKGFFNSSGNAGMATAGSGDVLTGILTGLLAQGYSPVEAALLGVYLHGVAGDGAAAALSMEAMIARDIIGHLGSAFRSIQVG